MDTQTPIIKNLSTSNLISKTTFPQIQQQFLDKSFLNQTEQKIVNQLSGVGTNQPQANLNASDWKSFSNELMKDDQKTQIKIKNQRVIEGKQFVKKQIQEWKVQLKESSGQKLKDLEHFFKMDTGLQILDIKKQHDQKQSGFFTERKRSVQESIDKTDLNQTKISKKSKNQMRMSLDFVNTERNKNQTVQELQSMKILHNVKYYNFFRDFQFPQSTQDIKEFIKQSQKQRPFKQIHKILEKRLSTYEEKVKVKIETDETLINSEQQQQPLPYIKNAIMNQRNQYVVLEEWFNFMIKKYNNENFEQLLVVAFAMGDLIQMEFLACNQKGQVLLKILQFFLGNQLRWLYNDDSKDKLISDLQTQLRYKKKFIKSQEEKIRDFKRKVQSLEDLMDEQKFQYKQLLDRNEILESKYQYEHRIMEQKFNKEREQLKKAHDEQKQIIEETLQTMVQIKNDSLKQQQKTHKTDDSLGSSDEDFMQQREDIYQQKLGRQDSMTKDLMQKNADFRKSKNEVNLLNSQAQQTNQKLGSTASSFKIIYDSQGNQIQQQSLEVEKPKRKMRLKTQFKKGSDDQVLAIKDQEIQTDQKYYVDAETLVVSRELSKDISIQVTPPIIYTYTADVQTDDLTKNRVDTSVQCEKELLEAFVQNQVNFELHKINEQQRILDEINGESISVNEDIEGFEIGTQRMSQINGLNTEGHRTKQNFQVDPKTMKNSDYAQRSQVNFSSAVGNNISPMKGVQQHKRNTSESQEQFQSKQNQFKLSQNTPVSKQVTALQKMKQNISKAIIKSVDGSAASSFRKATTIAPNIKQQQDQQQVLEMIKNLALTNQNIKVDEILELLQNQVFNRQQKDQDLTKSLTLAKQQPQSQFNRKDQSISQNEIFVKTGGTDKNKLQNQKQSITDYKQSADQTNKSTINKTISLDSLVNGDMELEQVMKQFEFSLKQSQSPLLNALLDQQDVKKLFRLVLNEASKQSENKNIDVNQKVNSENVNIQGNEGSDYQNIQSKLSEINKQKTMFNGDQQKLLTKDQQNLIKNHTRNQSNSHLPKQITEESLIDSCYEDEIRDMMLNDTQIAKVELPKILLKATDKFQKSLIELPKDEYGDYILHNNDTTDENTTRVYKRGQHLKQWIDQTLKEKDFSTQIDSQMNSNTFNINMTVSKVAKDQGTQTNQMAEFDSLKNLKLQQIQQNKESSTNLIQARHLKNQERLMKDTQSHINQSLLKKINSHRHQKSDANLRNGNLLVARDTAEIRRYLDRSSSVKKKPAPHFFPLPLNFEVGAQKPQIHPMTIFSNRLLVSLSRNEIEFFEGAQTISIKLLIKTMNTYLTDKAHIGNDHLSVKNQSLSEFIYDQCYNKFGIQKLAERKIKEVFFTIYKNYQKFIKCMFFAKILGLNQNSNNYSNDDLSLIYRVNKLLNNQQDRFYLLIIFQECF
eukprot:403361347